VLKHLAVTGKRENKKGARANKKMKNQKQKKKGEGIGVYEKKIEKEGRAPKYEFKKRNQKGVNHKSAFRGR